MSGDDYELRSKKGMGGLWALEGAPLPLSPPGRGGGTKPAPRPTEAAFRASVESEPQRLTPRGEGTPRTREWDLAKLRELVRLVDADLENGRGLNDWEMDAFPSMLEKLEDGQQRLTDKQRAKVNEAIDRLDVEVEPPEEQSEELQGMRKRR